MFSVGGNLRSLDHEEDEEDEVEECPLSQHPYFMEELQHEMELTMKRNGSVTRGIERTCQDLCHWDNEDDKHFVPTNFFMETNKSLFRMTHCQNDIKSAILPTFEKKLNREIKALGNDTSKFRVSNKGYIIPKEFSSKKCKEWWSGQRPSSLASNYIPNVLCKCEQVSNILCEKYKVIYGEKIFNKIAKELNLLFIFSLFYGIANDCTFSVKNCNERPIIPNGSYKFTNSLFIKKLREYCLSSFECLKTIEYGICVRCHSSFEDGICYQTNCKHSFCSNCYKNYVDIMSVCSFCHNDYENEKGIAQVTKKNINDTRVVSQIYFKLYKLEKKSTCLPAIKLQISRLKQSIRNKIEILSKKNDNIDNNSNNNNNNNNGGKNGENVARDDTKIGGNKSGLNCKQRCCDKKRRYHNENDNLNEDNESLDDECCDCDKCGSLIARLRNRIRELEFERDMVKWKQKQEKDLRNQKNKWEKMKKDDNNHYNNNNSNNSSIGDLAMTRRNGMGLTHNDSNNNNNNNNNSNEDNDTRSIVSSSNSTAQSVATGLSSSYQNNMNDLSSIGNSYGPRRGINYQYTSDVPYQPIAIAAPIAPMHMAAPSNSQTGLTFTRNNGERDNGGRNWDQSGGGTPSAIASHLLPRVPTMELNVNPANYMNGGFGAGSHGYHGNSSGQSVNGAPIPRLPRIARHPSFGINHNYSNNGNLDDSGLRLTTNGAQHGNNENYNNGNDNRDLMMSVEWHGRSSNNENFGCFGTLNNQGMSMAPRNVMNENGHCTIQRMSESKQIFGEKPFEPNKIGLSSNNNNNNNGGGFNDANQFNFDQFKSGENQSICNNSSNNDNSNNFNFNFSTMDTSIIGSDFNGFDTMSIISSNWNNMNSMNNNHNNTNY